ncbi:MAG: hypothetical protein SFV15_10450 [Polyangiaceae bacterium]|nr:hypothetical protein [Polyangiaceae bacterium]
MRTLLVCLGATVAGYALSISYWPRGQVADAVAGVKVSTERERKPIASAPFLRAQERIHAGVSGTQSKDLPVASCGGSADISVLQPERILPQTPLKNQQGLQRFLEQHREGFNAMRQALLPQIGEAIGNARYCFDKVPEIGVANVNLIWNVVSTEKEAEVSNIRIMDIEAFGQGEKMAMECLQKYVLGQTFRVTAGATEFAPYDGTYPNLMPLFLYRRSDHLAGRVSVGEDKVTLLDPN